MWGNPYITSVELSKLIGISDRKIKENIKILKETGIVFRIVVDKGGIGRCLDC